MDDQALLERSRAGDREAFTELVSRYQDRLYTMALRLLGSPDDAADVVQETFLRCYVNLPRLRGVAVRGWLFRVACNAARDVQRRAVRRPTAPLVDSEGNIVDLPDPGMGPDATAEAREQSQTVRQAILGLPHDYRQALVLRDVSDLSYEEIAQALRLPLGTVKSRLSRARALLAATLGGAGIVPRAAEGAC